MLADSHTRLNAHTDQEMFHIEHWGSRTSSKEKRGDISVTTNNKRQHIDRWYRRELRQQPESKKSERERE